MSSKKKGEKVLVIGLDGASPELIVKWAKEGKLPTFARLINNGVSGTLKSTIPPLTCPAWLSYSTGKNPGNLGVFDWCERKANTYEISYGVNFRHASSKHLWDILSEKGITVGIFNVPTTFPPREVNGFFVSGWPIPQGVVFTYPRDLQLKLDMYAGKMLASDHDMMEATWRWFSAEDEFLKGVYRSAEWEVKAAKYLMSKYDWNIFITVFTGLDPIQHYFWKHMDPNHPLHNSKEAEKYGNEILKFYQKMDKVVGELLEKVDEDARVMVMSDHGFGATHSLFNINDWLRAKGFLKINDKVPRLSFYRRISSLLINFVQIHGLLKIYYFLTDRSSVALAWTNKVRSLLGLTSAAFPPLEEVSVDWSNTKAYSLGAGNAGRIYINVKGREPQGIIEPGKEYGKFRKHIIEELRNLTDPETGKRVDVEVFKKEEIYHGEYFDQAPDIIFFLNGERTGIDWTFGHDSFFTNDLSTKHDNADHRMNGVLIMMGPGIKRAKTISRAEIIDLAPTILYMMGLHIPSDLDGKVLTDAFTSSHLRSNPIKYKKAMGKAARLKYEWSRAEEERIKERLKTLGYI